MGTCHSNTVSPELKAAYEDDRSISSNPGAAPSVSIAGNSRDAEAVPEKRSPSLAWQSNGAAPSYSSRRLPVSSEHESIDAEAEETAVHVAGKLLPSSISTQSLTGRPILGPADFQGVHWRHVYLHEELGRGHYGRVFRASILKPEWNEAKSEDSSLPDPYSFAVKCVDRKSQAQNQKDIETSMLKRLGHHEHIVDLYKTFKSANHIYYLMNRCTGGTLWEYIKRNGARSESLSLQIAHQLLLSVHHMHQKGVIHRDLKLENVLLTSPVSLDTVPHVQVCDFGTAIDVRWPPPSGGYEVTTQCYSPPETLSHKAVSPAVDIWAVGLMTFMMICGYHPHDEYADQTPHQVCQRIMNGDFNFNTSPWRSVSPSCRDLVASMMSLSPQDRPTAEQLLQHPLFSAPHMSRHAQRVESRRDSSDDMRPHRLHVSIAPPSEHDKRVPAPISPAGSSSFSLSRENSPVSNSRSVEQVRRVPAADQAPRRRPRVSSFRSHSSVATVLQ